MLDVAGTLTTLAGWLTDADVPAAVNAAQVRVPGVWVACESVEQDRLGADAGVVHARLVLIVREQDDLRAWEALQDLANAVDAALASHGLSTGGDIAVESVALPDNPATPLPALGIPLDLDVTPA